MTRKTGDVHRLHPPGSGAPFPAGPTPGTADLERDEVPLAGHGARRGLDVRERLEARADVAPARMGAGLPAGAVRADALRAGLRRAPSIASRSRRASRTRASTPFVDFGGSRYVAGGLAVDPDGSRRLRRDRARPGRSVERATSSAPGSCGSRRTARRRARISAPSCRARRRRATPARRRFLRTSARGRRRPTPCPRRSRADRSGPASTSCRRSRPTERSTRSAARTKQPLRVPGRRAPGPDARPGARRCAAS